MVNCLRCTEFAPPFVQADWTEWLCLGCQRSWRGRRWERDGWKAVEWETEGETRTVRMKKDSGTGRGALLVRMYATAELAALSEDEYRHFCIRMAEAELEAALRGGS